MVQIIICFPKSQKQCADTLLLGRTTYRIFEGYWPTAASNPATSQGDIEMAHIINNITKIVFSHSMEGVEWKKSRLLKEINPEEILKMKQEAGKNILVIGSASIVQQLTNLGLIDEYHLPLKNKGNNCTNSIELTLPGSFQKSSTARSKVIPFPVPPPYAAQMAGGTRRGYRPEGFLGRKDL